MAPWATSWLFSVFGIYPLDGVGSRCDCVYAICPSWEMLPIIHLHNFWSLSYLPSCESSGGGRDVPGFSDTKLPALVGCGHSGTAIWSTSWWSLAGSATMVCEQPACVRACMVQWGRFSRILLTCRRRSQVQSLSPLSTSICSLPCNPMRLWTVG